MLTLRNFLFRILTTYCMLYKIWLLICITILYGDIFHWVLPNKNTILNTLYISLLNKVNYSRTGINLFVSKIGKFKIKLFAVKFEKDIYSQIQVQSESV